MKTHVSDAGLLATGLGLAPTLITQQLGAAPTKMSQAPRPQRQRQPPRSQAPRTSKPRAHRRCCWVLAESLAGGSSGLLWRARKSDEPSPSRSKCRDAHRRTDPLASPESELLEGSSDGQRERETEQRRASFSEGVSFRGVWAPGPRGHPAVRCAR